MTDPDLVSALVVRDQRFAALQQSIAVEADMRDNPTIKAFIAALRADAELAMREFSTVSPLDAKTVAAQQVRVGAYELVKRMIETIITRGQIAEHDIRMQDQMSGLENDP